MARTMSDEQEREDREGHMRGVALVPRNEASTTARRLDRAYAELDAERAAHAVTKADAEGWRNGQAQVQRDFDLLYADTQALKAKLALAEAVCESCYTSNGDRNDHDSFDATALAAWRAAK